MSAPNVMRSSAARSAAAMIPMVDLMMTLLCVLIVGLNQDRFVPTEQPTTAAAGGESSTRVDLAEIDDGVLVVTVDGVEVPMADLEGRLSVAGSVAPVVVHARPEIAHGVVFEVLSLVHAAGRPVLQVPP